jgi:hypothetical protein
LQSSLRYAAAGGIIHQTAVSGGDDLPKISEFFGIAIYIYYREHQPPHFHAIYAQEEVLVSIANLSVIAGRMSPRAIGLVMEWASIHRDELLHCWTMAQAQQPLGRIEPLR